jgi:uncharacterized glyoxalase superfamily protein PhnB
MAKVSTYLNFMSNCEEAFNFYKSVFGTEFSAPIQYMKDVPQAPNMPALADDEKDKVMHVALPILDGHEIMGTDMLKSMGHELKIGNNVTISLQPDTLDEDVLGSLVGYLSRRVRYSLDVQFSRVISKFIFSMSNRLADNLTRIAVWHKSDLVNCGQKTSLTEEFLLLFCYDY